MTGLPGLRVIASDSFLHIYSPSVAASVSGAECGWRRGQREGAAIVQNPIQCWHAVWSHAQSRSQPHNSNRIGSDYNDEHRQAGLLVGAAPPRRCDQITWWSSADKFVFLGFSLILVFLPHSFSLCFLTLSETSTHRFRFDAKNQK